MQIHLPSLPRLWHEQSVREHTVKAAQLSINDTVMPATSSTTASFLGVAASKQLLTPDSAVIQFPPPKIQNAYINLVFDC